MVASVRGSKQPVRRRDLYSGCGGFPLLQYPVECLLVLDEPLGVNFRIHLHFFMQISNFKCVQGPTLDVAPGAHRKGPSPARAQVGNLLCAQAPAPYRRGVA